MNSSNKPGKNFDTVPNLSGFQEYLTDLANNENFENVLSTAFGKDYNTARAEILRNQWKTKDFSHLPSIEIISSSVLGSANAAYAASKKTIYLSDAFLATASAQSLVNVLLEEYGHYVDAYINDTDSPGDEGAIFSSLVLGDSLSAENLQVLKTEDDRATITVDARLLEVEQSITTSFISVDDITVGESDAYADFLVRLDAPNTGTVTVNYQNFNGTAANGYDYNAQSGYLTFAAGETVKTVRVTLINDTALENSENFGLELYSPSTNATLARNLATATIIDNDAAVGTPVVTINDFVIDEAAKQATFVITLNKPNTSVVSINYATQNGAAIAGSDFVATSGTLSFAPGETAKTVKVTLLNDTVAEVSEAFNLVLSGLTNATTLDPVGTAIIYENDATAVSVSNLFVDDITVGESDAYADFLVRLDAPNTGTVTVNYQNFNGTAANGYDYNAQSGYLTFAPGETVKTVRVTLINDTYVESSENFGLELSDHSTNATLARNLATATIIDNDATVGTPIVSINDFVIDEAAKQATFVITLNKPNTSAVSLNYATQNGAAIAGSDFVATSGTLSFAPGETAKTVKVTLLNDTVAEISEAFNLVLSGLTNATTLDPVGTAIIYENDATAVSVSNLFVDDITVGESDAYADFLVRLDAPNTGTVTVNYQNFNGTAANGYDYNAQSGYLTFAPGETVKTVRVTLINDTYVESSENFGLELSDHSTNATLARNLATATIIDNDATVGTPIVSINDFVIDEAAKQATFVITLNKPNTSAVSLNYATQNGEAVAGSDFVATSGTLSFAPGETAKTVKVTLLNDTVAEVSEAFNLVLSGLTNATTLDPVGTAIIYENDATAVSVSNLFVDDITVGESDAYADFLVRLDAPNTGTVTVNYQNFNGTAANGYDYNAQSGYLTFAAGETVKTVRVTLINDTALENSENFGLKLYSPSTNATLARNLATATIIDDDGSVSNPTITVVATDATATEGTPTTNPGTFTLTRTGSTTSALTVNYTLTGTATNATDYTSIPVTATFAAGSATATVQVTPIDDTVIEGSETAILTLSTGTGYTLGTVNNATVTIADNDFPVITIAATDATAAETATGVTANPGTFTLTRTGSITTALTVNYTLTGTATNATDYTSIPVTATFAAGSATATVQVTPIDDTVIEGSETAILTLSTGTGYTLGTANTATVTIADNDVPVITIAATDATAAETATGVTANPGTFTLTRTGSITTALTVNYTLTGTATNATDYTSIPVTATFAAGSATATVQVTPIDDTVIEGSETAILTLATGTGYTLGTVNNATVTIADNDFNPTLSINEITVVEGKDANALLTVSLSSPNTQQVTVNYSTSPIGATANVDYSSRTGTVIIPINTSTATLSIPIINDNINEPDEAFTLSLSNAVNATIDPNAGIGEVIITDTLKSELTRILSSGTENLTLIGTNNVHGTGNAGNNVITGNTGNNILTGGGGKDTLTGGAGNDRFSYTTLTDSLLPSYDVITDFNATAGNDLFLVATARTGFINAGSVTTLDNAGITAKLTNSNFGANLAAQFSFGTRTFVAINDATAGFNASTDSIVDVTGLTGILSSANFVTV